MSWKEAVKLVLAVCAIIAIIVGAAVTAPVHKPDPQRSPLVADQVPPGAKNVVGLGNGWYTFELNVGGRDRKFLYRSRWMGTPSGHEAVTELRD